MRCDPNAWAKDLAAPGLEGRIWEDRGLRISGRLGSNCADPVDLYYQSAQ